MKALNRILVLTLTLLFALPTLAENPESATEISQDRARKVLDSALEAIGGRKALGAMENLSWKLSGTNAFRFQATTVDPPYKQGTFEEKALLDIKGNRILADQSGDGAGFKFQARTKETIPNKPIRYVAVTHHHNDHSGGVRAFMAEKATLVTTAGNRKLFTELGSANHSDVLGKTPPPPSIEVLEGKKRVFKGGDQVVELIDIGPNPHADEMVIAYLPKQKILFQGDLFGPPESGPVGKAQAGTIHLAKKIHELGLQVDQVIGVHGRASTLAELDKNVADGKGSD